jgi:hypothetical protein
MHASPCTGGCFNPGAARDTRCRRGPLAPVVRALLHRAGTGAAPARTRARAQRVKWVQNHGYAIDQISGERLQGWVPYLERREEVSAGDGRPLQQSSGARTSLRGATRCGGGSTLLHLWSTKTLETAQSVGKPPPPLAVSKCELKPLPPSRAQPAHGYLPRGFVGLPPHGRRGMRR